MKIYNSMTRRKEEFVLYRKARLIYMFVVLRFTTIFI